MKIQKKNLILKNYSNINTNNIDDLYNEFCEEENHKNLKLKYFCKDHNKLCCAACLNRIKDKGDGQHADCEVCSIEDIKEEKKNKIKENIKYLEELSNKLNGSFNDIQIIFEKIIENKENLKLRIQKVFNKIRNTLNNREDELIREVDKIYDNLSFKDEIIKDIGELI